MMGGGGGRPWLARSCEKRLGKARRPTHHRATTWPCVVPTRLAPSVPASRRCCGAGFCPLTTAVPLYVRGSEGRPPVHEVPCLRPSHVHLVSVSTTVLVVHDPSRTSRARARAKTQRAPRNTMRVVARSKMSCCGGWTGGTGSMAMRVFALRGLLMLTGSISTASGLSAPPASCDGRAMAMMKQLDVHG